MCVLCSVVAALASAPSFMQCAAELIGKICDSTPTEDILQLLYSRGWTNNTGECQTTVSNGAEYACVA